MKLAKFIFVFFLLFIFTPNLHAEEESENTAEHPAIFEIKISPSVCDQVKLTAGSANELYCKEFVKNQSDPTFSRVYVPQIKEKNLIFGNKKIQDVANLVDTSFAMLGLGAGLIAVMREMPGEITKWSENDLKGKSLAKSWQENVGKPAKWDEDSVFINYVGHPLSGAGYYLIARENGLGPAESFLYSTLMSTIFWEYGLEATAEIPSKTDLIVTPLIGSALGELSYMAREKIKQQGGKLFGSKVAGSIVSVLLNPIGEIAEQTRKLLSPLIDNLSIDGGIYPSIDPNDTSKFAVMFGLRANLNDLGFDQTSRYAKKQCNLKEADFDVKNAAELITIYEKAIKDESFCKAAQAMTFMQINFPKESGEFQAYEKYMPALAKGNYLVTYLDELAISSQFHNTWAAIEKRSVELLQMYEFYLPKECTNPFGLILDKNKNRQPLRIEALMLAENFLLNFPVSTRAKDVTAIKTKILENMEKYKNCLDSFHKNEAAACSHDAPENTDIVPTAPIIMELNNEISTYSN